MKPKHYYNDTYEMNFWFCRGFSETQLDKFLKRFEGEAEPTQEQTGRTLKTRYKGSPCIIIWVKNKNAYDVMAHECLHAVNFIFDHIGIVPSFRNDEAQAYLLKCLMREFLK